MAVTVRRANDDDRRHRRGAGFTKGLGAVHAMSHAAGRIDHKLHHGTLNAACRPACLRHNHDVLGDKIARMKQVMEVPDSLGPGDRGA